MTRNTGRLIALALGIALTASANLASADWRDGHYDHDYYHHWHHWHQNRDSQYWSHGRVQGQGVAVNGAPQAIRQGGAAGAQLIGRPAGNGAVPGIVANPAVGGARAIVANPAVGGAPAIVANPAVGGAPAVSGNPIVATQPVAATAIVDPAKPIANAPAVQGTAVATDAKGQAVAATPVAAAATDGPKIPVAQSPATSFTVIRDLLAKKAAANEFVGMWTAAPAEGVKMAVDLKNDGTFTWQVASEKGNADLSGTYKLTDDTIVLTSNSDGDAIKGRIIVDGQTKVGFSLDSEAEGKAIQFARETKS